MKNILIVETDPYASDRLCRYLKRKGYEPDKASSGKHGLELCKSRDFDLVFCNEYFEDMDGCDFVHELMLLRSNTYVIVMGHSDVTKAVKALKMGAYDYLEKPLVPDCLLDVIQKIPSQPAEHAPFSAAQHSEAATHPGGTVPAHLPYITGISPAMQEIYRQVHLVAPTDYSVILYGESGTGKEVMARIIHENSPRSHMPFVAVDCGTLSRELANSELFGHVKGSFTGACADKAGYFEMADGGTLFLDEVANLSYETQAALLRVIQEKKYKRVGDTKERTLDIRILVASNENLREAYRKGKFREDLYHRFNEFTLSIPPLRERKEDIPLFADFFLQKANKELGKKVRAFSDKVMENLCSYPWPGNIRELRNVVRRAVLLAKGSIITGKCISLHQYLRPQPAGATENHAEKPLSRQSYMQEEVGRAEMQVIMKTLSRVNFNKSKAAHVLQIDRKTLYNKLRYYQHIS